MRLSEVTLVTVVAGAYASTSIIPLRSFRDHGPA